MCVLKLLKFFAVAINSILLIAGILITIFGVILWKTNLNTYGEETKKWVPPELVKVAGEAPQVPDFFLWMGKVVMSFGLVIVCLTIIGIFALTCCSKCKFCLVFYLILLTILIVVQSVLVAFSYKTEYVGDEVTKILTPVFTKEENRKKNYEFIIGTETFLHCCGVKGYRDYFCSGVYDPYCNFGCTPTVDFNGKKALPVCPEKSRKPEARGEKSDDPVCKEDAKAPFSFPNEPLYSDVPDFAALKLIDNDVTKPSDMPGCAEKVFENIEQNIKYVQITGIVVLSIEVFCMLVTIILICKGRDDEDDD